LSLTVVVENPESKRELGKLVEDEKIILKFILNGM
jgi:hypothetical protein